MPYDEQPVNEWPKDQEISDLYKGDRTFFNRYAKFDSLQSDSNNNNISRFYHEMSMGKFKLIADVFPKRIIINPEKAYGWTEMNARVIKKFSELNPNFDLSPYDQRTLRPYFKSDNSLSAPDSIPDYIVIVYRYSSSWQNQPVYGMNLWAGSYGGFSRVNGIEGLKHKNYRFNADGFTFCNGACNAIHVFLHEIGHELYNCPHYGGINGVVGNYFYGQSTAWGMTRSDNNVPFPCALAWERWILGWIPLEANNIKSDIKSIHDIQNNGIYLLRDFITYGDAVRIKIPTMDGSSQYLWLENHEGKSIFDRSMFYGKPYCGAKLPSPPNGILAYIESINDDKSDIGRGNLSDKANGIRYLHATGNFDFEFDYTKPLKPSAICENYTYNFHLKEKNPISGQNLNENIRGDFYRSANKDNGIKQQDGIIQLNRDWNSCYTPNEMFPVAVLEGIETLDYFLGNTTMAFKPGQKLGLGFNPYITNYPRYNFETKTIDPYVLNGITIEVMEKKSNGVEIKIKLDNSKIETDQRWAGNQILLPNISKNTDLDLVITNKAKVKIDRSQTPNTEFKIEKFNDFCKPTNFKIGPGATMVIDSGAKFIVADHSKLIIDSGATLVIKNKAEVIIDQSAELTIKNGGVLKLENKAKLYLNCNNNIITEPNSYINAVNKNTKIMIDNYIRPSKNNTPIKIIGKGKIRKRSHHN